MSQSQQHKLGRVRPPRVHITYDVHTGGALKKIDLPFVVGVMADLSADAAANLPPLKDRKFKEIDRDNLNDVLRDAAPEIGMRVNNTIANDGSQLAVKLKFQNMDDFSPAAVANQVEPLKRLLEERDRLNNILARMESNQKLEGLIEEVLANKSKIEDLAKQLGADAANSPKKEE